MFYWLRDAIRLYCLKAMKSHNLKGIPSVWYVHNFDRGVFNVKHLEKFAEFP